MIYKGILRLRKFCTPCDIRAAAESSNNSILFRTQCVIIEGISTPYTMIRYSSVWTHTPRVQGEGGTYLTIACEGPKYHHRGTLLPSITRGGPLLLVTTFYKLRRFTIAFTTSCVSSTKTPNKSS